MPRPGGMPPAEKEPIITRRETGCCLGVLAAAGIVIGGGIWFGNMLNEGLNSNSADSPAATASPFEHDTPAPQDTYDNSDSLVDPTESATAEETPEATATATTEAPADSEATQDGSQSAPKTGADKYKECPWDADNPQKPDSNNEVEIWSSCGEAGLAAYEFNGTDNPQVNLKDGDKVTAICKWDDGSGYIGVKNEGQRMLILAPDLGFVSVKDICQEQ